MMTQERKIEIDIATKAGTPIALSEQEIYDYWKLTYFPGKTDDEINAIMAQLPVSVA